MNEFLNWWWVRAAITGGLTYAAFRYLPAGSVWRMVGVAAGGLATVGIVAANAPVVGPILTSAMQGRLPLGAPVAKATT